MLNDSEPIFKKSSTERPLVGYTEVNRNGDIFPADKSLTTQLAGVPDDPSTEVDESKLTPEELHFMKDKSPSTGLTKGYPDIDDLPGGREAMYQATVASYRDGTKSQKASTESAKADYGASSTEPKIEPLTDDEYRRAKLQLLQKQNDILSGLVIVGSAIGLSGVIIAVAVLGVMLRL